MANAWVPPVAPTSAHLSSSCSPALSSSSNRFVYEQLRTIADRLSGHGFAVLVAIIGVFIVCRKFFAIVAVIIAIICIYAWLRA